MLPKCNINQHPTYNLSAAYGLRTATRRTPLRRYAVTSAYGQLLITTTVTYNYYRTPRYALRVTVAKLTKLLRVTLGTTSFAPLLYRTLNGIP